MEFGDVCHYCHVALDDKTRTADHIVPRAAGGSGVYENLVLACKQCNHKHGDSTHKCGCDRCVAALALPRRHQIVQQPQRPRRPLMHQPDITLEAFEHAAAKAHQVAEALHYATMRDGSTGLIIPISAAEQYKRWRAACRDPAKPYGNPGPW